MENGIFDFNSRRAFFLLAFLHRALKKIEAVEMRKKPTFYVNSIVESRMDEEE